MLNECSVIVSPPSNYSPGIPTVPADSEVVMPLSEFNDIRSALAVPVMVVEDSSI